MKGSYAVVFGDIIEFNKLLTLYENGVDDLKSRHKSTIHTVSEKYNGEILDFFTDSSKLVFKDPLQAVRFALNLFAMFSLEPRIPYRLSISYGTIEFDAEGIYGTAALMASRLLQKCSEGTVLITEEIARLIEHEKDLECSYVGNTYLKEFDKPSEVYCLSNKGLYVPDQMELSEKEQSKNTIAVLPFCNSSSEAELDYICEGLAEEIIDSLTKQEGLLVTARSSSFLFKSRSIPILEISRKLNVNYILDGSIRKRDTHYRISFQLVDSLTGYNVLSESISSDFENLYGTENFVVRKVLDQLGADKEGELNNGDYYIDPKAYDCYLRGKQLTSLLVRESVVEAIACFKRALEIVPDYSLAYAGMSYCYSHFALNGYDDFQGSLEKAVYYADKAIDSDSQLHEGYLSKALAIFWLGNWNVPEFEEYITKALKISPSNAEIRMFYGMMFLFKGDLDRSLIELTLAKQLDPYSYGINTRLGLVQYIRREYGEAYNTYLSILNYKDHYLTTALRLAWCCIQLKQYTKAIHYLTEAKSENPFYSLAYAALLVAYQRIGDVDMYHRYKTIIEGLPESNVGFHYNHAVLYKLSGNRELSVTFLEKVLQNRLMQFLFFQHDEFWEDLWDIPAFKKLMDSVYSIQKRGQIKIESETKEFLELSLSEFLFAEAQNNYTAIFWEEKNKVSERLLRATLSNIEDQLQVPEIVRCHRSYLVNTLSGFSFSKSAHKACLKHRTLDIQLPVSRSRENAIRDLFTKK